MKSDNTAPPMEANTGVKRITADFTVDAYNILDNTSIQLGISKAEVLRKALGLISFVLRHQKEGWTLMLEKDDKKKEIVTL